MYYSPTQVLVIAFDGIIRFLRGAQEAFDESNPQARLEGIRHNVSRAQRIIDELSAKLDMERGGTPALQFKNLYDSVGRELRAIETLEDPSTLTQLQQLFSELRDAWNQIANPTIPQAQPVTVS
jgi:flagellar biosynthetic protein FliS